MGASRDAVALLSEAHSALRSKMHELRCQFDDLGSKFDAVEKQVDALQSAIEKVVVESSSKRSVEAKRPHSKERRANSFDTKPEKRKPHKSSPTPPAEDQYGKSNNRDLTTYSRKVQRPSSISTEEKFQKLRDPISKDSFDAKNDGKKNNSHTSRPTNAMENRDTHRHSHERAHSNNSNDRYKRKRHSEGNNDRIGYKNSFVDDGNGDRKRRSYDSPRTNHSLDNYQSRQLVMDVHKENNQNSIETEKEGFISAQYLLRGYEIANPESIDPLENHLNGPSEPIDVIDTDVATLNTVQEIVMEQSQLENKEIAAEVVILTVIDSPSVSRAKAPKTILQETDLKVVMSSPKENSPSKIIEHAQKPIDDVEEGELVDDVPASDSNLIVQSSKDEAIQSSSNDVVISDCNTPVVQCVQEESIHDSSVPQLVVNDINISISCTKSEEDSQCVSSSPKPQFTPKKPEVTSTVIIDDNTVKMTVHRRRRSKIVKGQPQA